MITVEQAQRLILRHARRLAAQTLPLSGALGCVLAENVRVPVGLPHWDNSAMDGFALRSGETRGASASHPARFTVAGVVKAGDNPGTKLRAGQAMRIMTGAVIPPGADAVVALEDAVSADGHVEVRHPVARGRHIRREGEEWKRGARLPWKDAAITPGTAGFLATLGHDRVKAYAKPRVAVIVTGSELIPCGAALRAGKIYDSNSAMLAGALHAMGIIPVLSATVKDDRRCIRDVLRRALKTSDTVILAGGVSAGDYDYSRTILAELGVRGVFWKIRQKPGKPMYFGTKGRRLVFGLPGNPASAFVCFYEFVWPALRRQMGHAGPFLERVRAAAAQDILPDSSKTLFLKAKLEARGGRDAVRVLGHQASHMISSLHEAQGLAVIPPGEKKIPRGGIVDFDVFPFARPRGRG